MKKLSFLLGVSIVLASCGQVPSAPVSAYSPDRLKISSFVTEFEARVQLDIQRLGLSSAVTSQIVSAPKSYLNVLKVTSSTARAYFKTTYPQSTPCSIEWGDGSISTVTTPTPSSLSNQTQNHEYVNSGTYAIRLICGNDIKTVNFTAVVSDSGIDFEDVGAGIGVGNAAFVGSPYIYKGFALGAPTLVLDNSIYLPQGRTGIYFSGGGTIGKVDGSTFNLKSMTVASDGSPVTLTAIDNSDQVIGQITFSNTYNQGYATLALNWRGVKRVTSSSPQWWMDDLTLVQ
ncbi:hypothetical protein Daqu01_01188 [Deinococcus aquaticus]